MHAAYPTEGLPQLSFHVKLTIVKLDCIVFFLDLKW